MMIDRIICFVFGHKVEKKTCLRCGAKFGLPRFTFHVPPPPKKSREIKNHGDPNFRKTV